MTKLQLWQFIKDHAGKAALIAAALVLLYYFFRFLAAFYLILTAKD